MLNKIYTTKGRSSQLYAGNRRLTVTWLNLQPQVISRIKNIDKDGYSAVQVGIGSPRSGGAGQKKNHPRWYREIRLSGDLDLKLNDQLPIDAIVAEGDLVKVTGTSTGKGFAGVVKRHHFAGGPKTHGQSDRLRAPGAISRGTTPGRVVKGKKMAGRLGGDTVSVRNLKVVAVNPEKHQLAVSGLVPGATGGLVTLTVLKKHA